MNHDVVLKAVCNTRFEVELYETQSGKYMIKQANTVTEATRYSEMFNDYTTASFVFDLTVKELEGN